ncbi:MAG: hypothetical protein Q3996_01920 [Candidatus Saccharibacteria bacterium]|nr:hypothetical protein [Candidatus Saccharibacteria bacterium]
MRKYKVLYSIFTSSYCQAKKCSFEYIDDESSSFEDSISKLKSALNYHVLSSKQNQWDWRVVITNIEVEINSLEEQDFNYYFLHWRAGNNFDSLTNEGYLFFKQFHDQANEALNVDKQTSWIRDVLIKQEVISFDDNLKIINLKKIY